MPSSSPAFPASASPVSATAAAALNTAMRALPGSCTFPSEIRKVLTFPFSSTTSTSPLRMLPAEPVTGSMTKPPMVLGAVNSVPRTTGIWALIDSSDFTARRDISPAISSLRLPSSNVALLGVASLISSDVTSTAFTGTACRFAASVL